ncbi:hypothetical protein ACF1BQ_029950 [Bradyrhizobium sp. RDT10]
MTRLSEDTIGVENPKDLTMVVIGGVEGGTLWRNEMQRPPPPNEAIGPALAPVSAASVQRR